VAKPPTAQERQLMNTTRAAGCNKKLMQDMSLVLRPAVASDPMLLRISLPPEAWKFSARVTSRSGKFDASADGSLLIGFLMRCAASPPTALPPRLN